MSEETYLGPYSLAEALEKADEHKGIRCAVSVPNGAFLAIKAGKKTVIRRVADLSGRGGSVDATGAWRDEMAIEMQMLSWRPA